MFGERICILRCQKGLTQTELADMLHISASALGMYEQERRQPALDTLVQLAQVLDVSVDYLLTGKPINRNDLEVCTQAIHYLYGKFQTDICTLFSNNIPLRNVDQLVMTLLSSEIARS